MDGRVKQNIRKEHPRHVRVVGTAASKTSLSSGRKASPFPFGFSPSALTTLMVRKPLSSVTFSGVAIDLPVFAKLAASPSVTRAPTLMV